MIDRPLVLTLSDILRLRTRAALSVAMMSVFLLTSCQKPVPVVTLKKAAFTLQVPGSEGVPPFQRIKHMCQDSRGNFFILDADANLIYQFDAAGKFVSSMGGLGRQLGLLDRAVSVNVLHDSLLLVHNQGVMDIWSINGTPLRYFFVPGCADIRLSQDGRMLVNRMMDAFQFKFFMEIRDLEGNLVQEFKPPRALFYKNEYYDFGYFGNLSEGKLAYAPAYIDSIFIYDMTGNILKSAVRKCGIRRTTEPVDSLLYQVEDLYVWKDRIFLLLVDPAKGLDGDIICRDIAEYNVDLQLVRIYRLPQPITLSIPLEEYAPWYHKFLVNDQHFYFMVSKPVERLQAYYYQ